MSIAIPPASRSHTTPTIADATQTIKDIAASPIAQGLVGFGIGVATCRLFGSLTGKIITALGITATLSDPFKSISYDTKVLLTPFVCVLGPILEEMEFRGWLQGSLKDNLEPFFTNRGFSASNATLAARVTSVFFASVIFGLIHFTNALFFWCNPILFLPQVIAATLMGLVMGLAKELSGDLALPIGMHIGNNTFAWAHIMNAPA